MGVKNRFTEHFSIHHLKPTHDEPILFVVSQWQFNKKEPGVLYLIYRSAVAAFLVTTWALSFETPSWGVFLTNWGYTVAVLQALLGFILSCSTVLSNAFSTRNVHDIFLQLYPLYWIVHQMAISIGFMITIIFWAVLYRGSGMAFTAMNFFVHGSNSICLFLDLLIIGHPIRILHFIYPFIFGIAYAIFSVIYYFYDTNRGGPGYIYFILDWNYPFQTILVVLGITLLVLVLHLLSYGIHELKVLAHKRMFPQNVRSTTSHTHSTEQLQV